MVWWPGNNKVRAAELQEMARMRCERLTRSRWDLLKIELETPDDLHSRFVVTREGHPIERYVFSKSKDVQKYIHRFYVNLLYNGSGAPNDVFLDSLNKTT
jgi:hypothetical protein